MNDPNPSNPPQPDPRGSRRHGFGLFWLTILVGTLVTRIVYTAISPLLEKIGAGGFGLGLWLSGLLPWIGALVLAIWLAHAGKSRTAQGVAFGFLSVLGIGLLLVAACFGLLSLDGSSKWH